jgi:predicted SnoaL-like aldol condensation-catalyzing enzyme
LADADNKQVVMDWYETAFVKKDAETAADKYMGPSYTQHNPEVPDGLDAFKGAIGGMHGAFPEFSTEVKRILVDGDLVALHHHVKMTADERGNSVVDIMRLENGRIVEHWDVIQPIPEESANDNTMF